MISNPRIAKQVSDLMLDIFSRVDESLAEVKKTCSPEEVAAYRTATSHVVGSIVMDVLEPLYEAHPALKPHNWDD
jgi:hypothetical protein